VENVGAIAVLSAFWGPWIVDRASITQLTVILPKPACFLSLSLTVCRPWNALRWRRMLANAARTIQPCPLGQRNHRARAHNVPKAVASGVTSSRLEEQILQLCVYTHDPRTRRCDSRIHVSRRGVGIMTTLLLASIHLSPVATSFPVSGPRSRLFSDWTAVKKMPFDMDTLAFDRHQVSVLQLTRFVLGRFYKLYPVTSCIYICVCWDCMLISIV
jgi:hypothetical protein